MIEDSTTPEAKTVHERIRIVQGDITRQAVDAIVNAANSSLLGGGGVDGAIHSAAGPELLQECRALRGCPTGDAKITRGYLLPAKWVIHTVGPVWQDGSHDEAELLASCYRNSLRVARDYHAATVAFPSISTGAYRFPVEQACRIALGAIREHLLKHRLPERVIVVCFDSHTTAQYRKACAESVTYHGDDRDHRLP